MDPFVDSTVTVVIWGDESTKVDDDNNYPTYKMV